MHLLVAVIEDEDLVDEVITGWMDLGVSGATVIETTGALKLVAQHVPIFAGLRALVGGAEGHNKTIFAAIEDDSILEAAITFLMSAAKASEKKNLGIYFVCPVDRLGRLG